ncbi:hypothetical protein [Nostoc sp. TCL26-01]|uniref:hypothetical protein n=1 Tax=Nostoc sp. TCL26-01 TaxID=2576904 RepID=UPI0015BAD728|nr:hypothetical protein [Nostoc sp. TCL26-01]QLE56013.1 hypothetical protein FD725_11035 [Nostoc sp. TCL26-01]
MSNQLFTELSLEQQEIVVGAGLEYRPYPSHPVKQYSKPSPYSVKDKQIWKPEPKEDKWLKEGEKIEEGNGTVIFNLYFDDIYFDDFIINV